MKSLKTLLNPKSIAIIGASRDRTKLGRIVLNNVVESGYKGKIYAVNPKANKIGKFKSYHSILDIPGSVDLAVIAIPAAFVTTVAREIIEKKVKSVIVISAGFSEVGAEGLKHESQLKELFETAGINFLGPNCLGVINTRLKLNATFAKNTVQKGSIAFISQSGALGTAVLDWAEETGVGLSHFVSIGNKAGLGENELISYLAEDNNVSAIALYLEDFSDGHAFIKLAKKVKKPIVILKPGKTEAAQKALGSHTGSMAQNDLIVSAALKQAKVVRVFTIEELFNVIQLFAQGRTMKGNNVAVVTNAGGPGVVTTDALELKGLSLAKFSRKTEKLLTLGLPQSASSKNPVDVLGDARSDRYKTSLEGVCMDDHVDSVIVLLTPQVMTEIEETASIITKLSKKTKKLIVTSFIGGKEVKKGTKILSAARIPTFRFPSDAVDALSYVWHYVKQQKRASRRPALKRRIPKISNTEKAARLLAKQSGVIDAQDAEKILEHYHIPTLKSLFPQDIADARRMAKKLGYPVVLKVVHPKLLHKTDVNAVKLNLLNDAALAAAYSELMETAQKLKLEDAKIEMQHFVRGALEIIIGVKKDGDQYSAIDGKDILRKKGFGHSIVFGRGGIYAEIDKDFALRVAPLKKKDIWALFDETKVGTIVSGARGKSFNGERIAGILANISQLVADFPQIAELDINPLFAKGRDVWVVDVKMIVG